ncbi:MAG: hypothetical protein HN580_01200 [Deltaproteobacteria bacterium]|jgi:hypothetical protein|nr:hypothetical protein [Deltaproteobacteria bacterium]MBT4641030.1 hypothetical protein [Deltaproteobacteria bacterium]MBT7887616.1 hypothetical protein [Deltaproteobacteria bacterium]
MENKNLEETTVSNENGTTVSGEEVTKIVNSNNDFVEIDVAAFRKHGEPAVSIIFENSLSGVTVRKPKKTEFYRTHANPEFCLKAGIIELDDEHRSYYLVAPHLLVQLERETKAVVLYTCINRKGELFISPINSHSSDGSRNKWSSSALDAAEKAKEKWVRVIANMSKSQYDVIVAKDDLPDPDWPDMSFNKLINIAFKGRYITDLNHEVLKELRGEI